MSLFESDIFEGHRPGYGLFGLGDLPDGAVGISAYRAYPSRFPALPSLENLRSKGVTHFVVNQAGGGSLRFTFTDESGSIIQQQTVRPTGGEDAAKIRSELRDAPLPARSEDDGLLPGSAETQASGAPKWLPYALIGGGVLVAGGILWAATAKPKRVTANRRRRRRRRTSR